MYNIILLFCLLGAAPDILFGDDSPHAPGISRGTQPNAAPTVYNRLDQHMRTALEERGKGVALYYRDLDNIARRKAIRSDLYRFALAKFKVISLPWKDAEVAYIDNLCEDVAKPYDLVPPRQQVFSDRPVIKSQLSSPEDFTTKRWHSANVKGRIMDVWGVKDPDNIGMIIIDVSEQPPDVQASFARPATTYNSSTIPMQSSSFISPMSTGLGAGRMGSGVFFGAGDECSP